MSEYYSLCCDALPYGEIYYDCDSELSGICSECREHTTFYAEDRHKRTLDKENENG